jgi:endonuclease/exonuclease/phosphatase family metal-dependent hydrolase
VRLRVVTWNVHGCVGPDGRFLPARTALVLAALAPDLALLQEVGDNRGVRPPVDQAGALAGALGLACVVGLTLKTSLHGYGQATLTRLPVLGSETLDLSVPGREPRLALEVDVGRDEVRLRTLNVHLGLGASERRAQLRRLLPHLRPGGARVVLGGDFNDFPPGPVSLTLRHRLVDAAARLERRRTFPSRWPILRLDRVYCSTELGILGAFVDRSARAREASDHLPVVVDIEPRPPALSPESDPP